VTCQNRCASALRETGCILSIEGVGGARIAPSGRTNPFKETVMNRHLIIALTLTCGAAANAFADDITVDPNPFVSTASRAEVREELAAFRRAGVNPWADEYNQLSQFRGARARAEVRSEFLAGRTVVGAFSGEDSGSMYLARMNGTARHGALILAGGQ
jgi:hypothetical protein